MCILKLKFVYRICISCRTNIDKLPKSTPYIRKCFGGKYCLYVVVCLISWVCSTRFFTYIPFSYKFWQVSNFTSLNLWALSCKCAKALHTKYVIYNTSVSWGFCGNFLWSFQFTLFQMHFISQVDQNFKFCGIFHFRG